MVIAATRLLQQSELTATDVSELATFYQQEADSNPQQHKMTDRYLLICDMFQPLELNVVDSYQAGEILSTKNLSGGESFIVSLSLALGLSHMASKGVRVDSLFLKALPLIR